MNEVRLDLFDASTGLDREMPLCFEIVGYLAKMFFFLTAFPWKLEIGNHSWIGKEAFILNFEPLIVKSNVCISQRVFLCGGGYDYKDRAFSYRNGPIHLDDGVWVGAQSFITANMMIGKNSVISSGSVVT